MTQGSRAEVRMGQDGVWFARPYLGTDRVTGKRIRPYRSFPDAQTREEAQAMADEWLAGVSAGLPDGVSVAVESMLGRWIEDQRSVRGLAASTAYSYASWARLYVNPYLGSMAVYDVRPVHVAAAYSMAARAGASASTLACVHAMLSGAFKSFVARGVCEHNPVASVEKPRPSTAEAAAYDEWEFFALRDALAAAMADGSHEPENIERRTMAFGFWLSLNTGARCGEVCALELRDFLRRSGDLRIGHTMSERPAFSRTAAKGKRTRNVKLSDAMCDAIGAHAAWQDGFLPRMPGRPLVTLDGGFMRPSALSAAYSRLRDSMGMPKGTSMHTLRHTHASWLLAQGVDVKTVSERLGHANVATTLSLYAHILPGRDSDAARAFSEIRR